MTMPVSRPGSRHAEGFPALWRRALPILLLAVSAVAGASEPVRYTVHLDRPQTQTFDVTVELTDVTESSLDFLLPVWRPGRYVVLDPAGGLRDVEAWSGAGEALPVQKVDKSTWRVETRGADRLRVSYRVYANELGLRTRHVDDSHAFLSGSAVFLYEPARRSAPVVVEIEAPAEWRIASGLERSADDPRTLVAPDYDVLVDSPIEVGLHDRLEFEVDGVPHEIVIWPPGRRYDAERLKRDFAAIVSEQASLFGDLPYRRYLFLLHVGRGAGGGTEHLNSTVMQTSLDRLEASLDPQTDDAYRRLLGLTSHEMFHTWNVKRLRPTGIQPYDYQRENYSTLFWVAEGTTSYYDDLTLLRAELVEVDDWLESLSEAIDDHRRRPGAAVQSLAESSFDAWIKHGRSSPDSINSTVSFYSKGALVSMLLDLEIRRRTGHEVSLDDVLRTLYRRHPLDEGGYAEDDLRAVLEELAGGSFDGFFRDYVEGTAPLPLEERLGEVGLELALVPEERTDDDEGLVAPSDPTQPPRSRARLGLLLEDRDGRTVVSAVLADGPAYLAGVLPGDELVAIDRVRRSADEVDQLLRRHQPGDVVTLHLVRHRDLLELRIELTEEPDAAWQVRPLEEPSSDQRRFWQRWTERPWPKDAAAEEGE